MSLLAATALVVRSDIIVGNGIRVNILFTFSGENVQASAARLCRLWQWSPPTAEGRARRRLPAGRLAGARARFTGTRPREASCGPRAQGPRSTIEAVPSAHCEAQSPLAYTPWPLRPVPSSFGLRPCAYGTPSSRAVAFPCKELGAPLLRSNSRRCDERCWFHGMWCRRRLRKS